MTISAGCVAPVALTIAADDVIVRGDIVVTNVSARSFFHIQAGATSVVDVQNRDGVTFKTLVSVDGGCPGVQ